MMLLVKFVENNQAFNPDFGEIQIINGEDGKSAFDIAVENGYEGTEEEWLNSLKGKDGYTPIKGEDYYTDAEKTELINSVISALPIYDGEVIAE